MRKAYTVTIGNFSIPPTEDQIKVLNEIHSFDGLIGIHPHYPDGTLILLDTKNHAIEAKNLLEYMKVKTGDNIVEVEIDE